MERYSDKKIWNGVWRETSDSFVDYLDKIDEPVFHYAKTKYGLVLYVDSKDCRNDMDNYMQSFVSLFISIAGIEQKPYCLFFIPDTNNYYIKRDLIIELLDKFKECDVLILYRNDCENRLIENAFESCSNVKVTYNSELDIGGYCNVDGYLSSLSSKRRCNIKNSIKRFNAFETLDVRKFDIRDNKIQVIKLYKECCDRHEDFVESKGFLNNLDSLENVDWYGVFDRNDLVMFSGFWKNSDSVVLGFFGKDYKKEKIIRDSRSYYMLMLKMIEDAISDNYCKVYDGFGVEEVKKRMGFKIIDYSILVKSRV